MFLREKDRETVNGIKQKKGEKGEKEECRVRNQERRGKSRNRYM